VSGKRRQFDADTTTCFIQYGGRGALASAKHSGGAWVAPLPQEEVSRRGARTNFTVGGALCAATIEPTLLWEAPRETRGQHMLAPPMAGCGDDRGAPPTRRNQSYTQDYHGCVLKRSKWLNQRRLTYHPEVGSWKRRLWDFLRMK